MLRRRVLVPLALAVAFAGAVWIRSRIVASVAGPASPDSTAHRIEDLDGDGRPDPLPIRRLGERSGGLTVIDAIAASGGWEAWAGSRSARFRLESVLFDERGAIQEVRTEQVTMNLSWPLRVRIESDDGLSVAGFGASGAWGASRTPDGPWRPGTGPGGLPGATLRNLLFDAWWLFVVPFNLGDVDVELEEIEASSPDSLAEVVARYASLPGGERVYRLRFDAGTGHVSEVVLQAPEASIDASGDEALGEAKEHEAPSPVPPGFALVMKFSDPVQFEGIIRPVRRTVYEIEGTSARVVSEQRVSEVEWDLEILPILFEPPQAP